MKLKLADPIDWELLSKFYKLNNWRWARANHQSMLPSAKELHDCVVDLVAGLRNLDHPQSQSSTGRLTVFRVDDVIKVWVGNPQKRNNCVQGFWAHKLAEKFAELQEV
jgi:hypothetical protein